MTEPACAQQPLARQVSLLGSCSVEEALKHLSQAGIEERGAIFTRREVVEFILDLVEYMPDRPLHKSVLLEPSFGDGDFLLVAVERLLEAWHHLADTVPARALGHCIRAVELHQASFEVTRAKLAAQLQDAGMSRTDVAALIDAWLIHDDFLLADLPHAVHFVVGNPPYVRRS